MFPFSCVSTLTRTNTNHAINVNVLCCGFRYLSVNKDFRQFGIEEKLVATLTAHAQKNNFKKMSIVVPSTRKRDLLNRVKFTFDRNNWTGKMMEDLFAPIYWKVYIKVLSGKKSK